MDVRRYIASDHEAVLSLHRAGLQQMGADRGPGPWDADLDDIENSYLRAGGEFLVADLHGELVAMGGLLPTGEHVVDLKRLRVRPDMQGLGVGEHLARSLLDRARELGVGRVTADTTTRQLPAQRLFAKLGFTEIGRVHQADMDVVLLELTL
jgi:GNAT superfamily N-acetyltransferase